MLSNNSFTKVAIKASGAGVRNSSEYKKAFLHVQNGRVYLLSHIQTIGEPIANVPMHGMRCVTDILSAADYDTFAQIECARTRGVDIAVCHNPEVIAQVHNRAASTEGRRAAATAQGAPALQEHAQAADPYTLPNYTRNMYTGFASYHASHRQTMNTPTNGYRGYRIGVELETEFASSSAHSEFTSTPRNWFFCESDSSLQGHGCEIITIPLTPADAKSRATWKPICDRLKSLGATSWNNNRCGLHVHIGREILGDTAEEREATLSRLLLFYNLYLNDDATATKVFGRARCYHERHHDAAGDDGTQEFAAVKCLGASVLKDKEVAKRVGDAVKAKQSHYRYYTINTTNAATIEFRKGRGSLSVDRIQTIITFCEAVCLYVRTSDDVSALTVEGFREFIRNTVPATNSLYHYYEVVERDC